MLEFEVQCDTVPGEVVAICGSEPLSWDAKQAVMLDPTDYPAWRGRVAAPQSDVEFKYLIVKRGEGGPGELVRWEGDFPNRKVHRENDVAKLVLRHRFGDVTFECKEVVHASGIPEKMLSKPGGGYAEVPEATRDAPALPISKRGEEEAEEPDESVLGKIAVDPALRLARLVRSTSATAFSMKYDVKSTVLGTGMSGGVVVGTNKETGVEVAIKKLPLNSSMNLEHIKSEIQHQLTLDHPNICRLLEVYEEPDRLLMVMEKLDGPDLFDSLSKKSRYTEKDAREVVKQILSAVAYCHRNGVCHRDLKLENFCMEDKSEHARIKMIDFGLSSSFDDSLPMTDSCGTLYYVAPEVLRGKYNQQCDMWSLGVLTYILLDGRAPFMGRDDRRTYRLILEGQYNFPENRWGRISDDAKSFVSKLLKVDPEVRMTAEEALMHPWLTSKEPQALSEAESAPPALDADVLDGLKALTRGNAAKRAVLRAMAPVASVDEVSRWADQFETFDAQGTGHVKVSDLVQRLVSRGLATAAEAQAISDGLKTVADSSQEISYSAFLTACLCAHHSRLEEKHLKEIFSKLDKDKDNHVSVEEVGKALGGVVNIEALESEMNGRALSFSDFQWLFQRPLAPSSMAGLRQLLGTFQNLGLTKSWRVDTVAAKAADGHDAQFVAARRENAAWRQWHRQRKRGESPEEPPACRRPSEDDSKDRLSPKKLLLETAPLPAPNSSRPPSRAPSSRGNLTPREIPIADLVEPNSPAKDTRDKNDNGELKKEWAVATAEAKDGDMDAARRENRAWRLMNMERCSIAASGSQVVCTALYKKLHTCIAAIRHEEFVVSAGQRLALLGPNGCGKTTLLRSLAGRLEVEAGCRILGAGGLRRARVAFFTQDLAQDLPGDITPVEHVLGDDAPISLDKEGARAALGALGLRGACHNAPIKTLSGGEKLDTASPDIPDVHTSRLEPNDEPTNHLDGAAVASLCAGLREHGGAVLVSSHDKAFLEALRVTDQVHIARAEVGEPGHLKVIHAPVARHFGAVGAAPSAPAGASAHVAAESPGPAQAVMRRIEHAEGLLQEAADAMNAEYNEDRSLRLLSCKSAATSLDGRSELTRCRNDVAWAAEHGLEENPEWYPELRQGADWKDIALVLYVHGQPGCPRPCDKDEPKGHYVPYDPDKEEKDNFKDDEESKEFEEVPDKGSEHSHEDSGEDEEQTPEEDVARLENLIQTQKDRSQIKKVQVEMDDCARPGIAYHPTIVESPRNFKSSNECRVHCRTWPGAGYFTFYAPLSVCHCSPYGATKEEVADMNNLAGALDCGATWEEINKASLSQRKLQGLSILAHEDMCAQPPILPQSLPPPPPHFGQLRGPKQSRRATCPALTQREESMYEPCVGQAHPSPPSAGCHPMERSLPKGSIYDQPMQYMIVLPESQTPHGRSSSKRSQIRLGQSGAPEGSLEPQGRRQHLQSMLEEKSDDGLGLASQRSEAREARSHSARQGAAAEPAEHSIENCDAGCLGRRPSIVEEKRLQQRQWHQQLRKARQLEKSESQLQRQEERSRADQWSERKLQEEQLRSKECQIQEVHQKLRRPARDALASDAKAAAEVTGSKDLVLTSSILEPPSTKSQENSGNRADRRAGRQTLHSCRILGVSPDDGPDLIQQQYRRGALKRHPDKGGSHDQFTQLQAARDYMEARQSAHGDDMGGARRLQGDQRGALGRLRPPAEAQPPAPESVKEMAAISLCASPPPSTSSARSLPLGARSSCTSMELGMPSVPVQDLMVRQERTINLNPDPPPYPINAACSGLMQAAPAATQKESEASEMMLDLTGEVPVHVPFSQPRGHRNAVADAPPPPLAPSEPASESWDPESEDISDSMEDVRAAASSPSQVEHSLRRGVASASQKAESSVALPPAPEAKAASPAVDHEEHPHRHRTSSRASQTSSSEAGHGPQRRSPGWHTIDSCEVLGVTPNDGYESIQKQYRQKALRHHPDKGGRASLFRQLHDARDYLSSKQPARWQRPAHSESRPHQPPATSRARKPASQAMPEVQEQLCSSVREKAPSDHSSFDTVEIKSRRWQRMTGSTVCPQSPRNTSSSLSDDGTLGHPSPVSGHVQQALLPVPGYYDDGGSPRGPAAQAAVRATPRQAGHSVRWEGSFSPQARAPEAWSDRSGACSRQALESSVQAHLRTMDAHCAALTDTYHRLASLHGELGQVFVDLQHAWAPLHDEAGLRCQAAPGNNELVCTDC
eukprot:s723_g17.t4